MKKSFIFIFVFGLMVSGSMSGQEIEVPLRFDRYYTYDQVNEAMQALHQKFPELTSLDLVGYSEEDRANIETPVGVFAGLADPPEHRFFLVTEWQDKHQEITNILADRVASGELKYRETIAEGLENAPEAFKGMLKGKNFGKQLVHIAD